MSSSIGGRLIEARKALDLTQDGFSTQTGLPLSTLKKYEGEHREPGSEALALIAKAGVNLHWLITGDGAPLVAAQNIAEQPRAPTAEINAEALAAIMAAVEFTNPKASPPERAAIAARAYVSSIREGLITATGPGHRAPKRAA